MPQLQEIKMVVFQFSFNVFFNNDSGTSGSLTVSFAVVACFFLWHVLKSCAAREMWWTSYYFLERAEIQWWGVVLGKEKRICRAERRTSKKQLIELLR